MNEKIRLTTQFAVARAFQEFALKLGIGEEYSDLLAQIHAKSSKILENWSKFLESNCAGCSHSPDSCIFFHPKIENCMKGANPQSTRRANVTVVENGVLRKCPAFSHIRKVTPQVEGSSTD